MHACIRACTGPVRRARVDRQLSIVDRPLAPTLGRLFSTHDDRGARCLTFAGPSHETRIGEAECSPASGLEVAGLSRVERRQYPPAGEECRLEWLVDRGYARLDLVESPGDVAKRGDILDVWILGDSEPSRIQFFDDEIEAIHRFDVSTQRSVGPLVSLTITAVPASLDGTPTETTDLFSLLPEDALIILDNPGVIQEMGETIHARLGDSGRLTAVENLLEAVVRFPQAGMPPTSVGLDRRSETSDRFF